MQDVGRVSQGRTRGGGHSSWIPNARLFERFTYTPEVLSDGVKTEKPYYCYNAESMILKGTCHAGPAAKTLEKEGLFPVLTPGGEALASIWVNQLKDSVIGPYHEIVFALDAAPVPNWTAPDPRDPYALLYNFFGGQCVNYLHTLYISSPLSIRWGREMQAFPKHPDAAHIASDWGCRQLRFDTRWEEKLIVAGTVGNRWGLGAFLVQAAGLVRNFGPWKVTRFLTSPVAQLPIAMPKSLRDQHGITCSHLGHILKGYDPAGIRSWPWQAGDRLELGQNRHAEAADGQESAPDLWREAGFQPGIVVHVPSLQLVVTDHHQPF